MPIAETAEQTRSLHGDWAYGLKIGRNEGRRTLFKRWHAMEFALYERIRSQVHTDYPGIHVLDLFQARPVGSDWKPESLEAAVENNPHYQRFLLSFSGRGLAVITSRIGYNRSGIVSILPPHEYAPEQPVDAMNIYDSNGNTNDPALTQKHLERIAGYGVDRSAPIEETLVTDTFRFMVSCSPERQ